MSSTCIQMQVKTFSSTCTRVWAKGTPYSCLGFPINLPKLLFGATHQHHYSDILLKAILVKEWGFCPKNMRAEQAMW